VTIAAETHVGMTWIPGGSFLMGSAEFYPEEAPVRRVKVEGFWIDERLVTVAEFRRFGRRPAMAWFSGLLKPDLDTVETVSGGDSAQDPYPVLP
jgi:formylglycine-generating enzyme required for sulfatase activity